jgi:hypothetical protein
MTESYDSMIKTEQREHKEALDLVDEYKRKYKARMEMMKKAETKADKNRLRRLAIYAREQGDHFAALAKIHAAEIKNLKALKNRKPRKRAKRVLRR